MIEWLCKKRLDMSIIQLLARQSLIAQKNNLQYQMLQNSRSQRQMLSNPAFMGNLEAAHNYETSLCLENSMNGEELMAINAELNALNNLDYFA